MTSTNAVANEVERVLREWERADLDPVGAGVRRGMTLEIRLAMRRAQRVSEGPDPRPEGQPPHEWLFADQP